MQRMQLQWLNETPLIDRPDPLSWTETIPPIAGSLIRWDRRCCMAWDI